MVSVQPAERNSPGKLIYKFQSRDSTGEATEYSQLNISANREKSDITDKQLQPKQYQQHKENTQQNSL